MRLGIAHVCQQLNDCVLVSFVFADTIIKLTGDSYIVDFGLSVCSWTVVVYCQCSTLISDLHYTKDAPSKLVTSFRH